MATSGKSRWPKVLLVLVLLGGAAVGGVWYAQGDHTEPPQYQTATVTRGDVTQAVTANGTLNPVLNVQVGSQISGNILKLFADYNSLVKSNQVVAQLDSSIYQAILQQSEGELANARAGLELQEVEARRADELFKEKLISRSDYDKAQATLHQAEAQIRIREASRERARVDLAHCTIYAPVDGIVISRNVDVGQTVAASMNAPTLFVVANDLSKMQINANVSEADVGTVEEGQTVTFTVDAFPSRTFTGKVTQIRNSPVTVQNVVTYDTVIEVSNPDMKLKPGMTATASIVTAERKGVLKIPNSALRFKPPEPSTNQSFAQRWLARVGLSQTAKTSATNAPAGVPAGTNKVEVAESKSPPLTGNEPPEELFRRLREMRERGEEPSPELRAKMRELFQSGALQRPGGEGGGGGRMGGFGGGAGGGGSRTARSGQPSTRTIYTLASNTPATGGPMVPTHQPARVKTGITDGTSTEITEGLKEGDMVITSVRLPQTQATAAMPGGSSPFGGGGGPGMRRF